MPLQGKGWALRRQRENLEAIGFSMARVEEVHADPHKLPIVVIGSVTARDKTFTAQREVLDRYDEGDVLRCERAVRADLARQYAEYLMGPPTAVEYETLHPAVGVAGGSAGGAREAVPFRPTPAPNTRVGGGGRRVDAPASAAEIVFIPTADGVSFVVTFGSGEYDAENVAHRTAVDAITALSQLGKLSDIKLTGSDGATAPLTPADREVAPMDR